MAVELEPSPTVAAENPALAETLSSRMSAQLMASALSGVVQPTMRRAKERSRTLVRMETSFWIRHVEDGEVARSTGHARAQQGPYSRGYGSRLAFGHREEDF